MSRQKLRRLARAVAFKYDPNQPRVPAGNPEGGQWLTLAGVLAPDRLVREKPPPSTRQMCKVLFRLLGGNELLAVRSVIKDVWTFATHSWKGPKTLGATATPGTSTNA